jgi:hypothetical protein
VDGKMAENGNGENVIGVQKTHGGNIKTGEER